MDVFINDVSAFLPNAAVTNEEIENVLGKMPGVSSKARQIVLKNNRIRTRYYAIDPQTGKLTHTNAQLTAEAVRRLRPCANFGTEQIQCLACGTSTPDLLFPGHGLMVLGELGIAECDAVTTAGICVSGMSALKYAWMNVACGISENAAATGSELASSYTRAKFMNPCISAPEGNSGLEKQPIRAFDADFLRWMLSDGAGAAFVSAKPNPDRISLKIEWIEHISLAGKLETCMYGGGVKKEDGSVTGWRETEEIPEEQKPWLFSIRQDIRLLDREIIASMGNILSRIAEKKGLRPETVDHFLPHYSSHYFRQKFFDEMQRIGFGIGYEKWFTNLGEKGNTGSAAMYIILEEIFHSGSLKPGEKLLCFIPESGRFSHCFMLLTVV